MTACVLVEFVYACAISVVLHAQNDKKRKQKKEIESRIRVSPSGTETTAPTVKREEGNL
jgi:hypothetical protein